MSNEKRMKLVVTLKEGEALLSALDLLVEKRDVDGVDREDLIALRSYISAGVSFTWKVLRAL
jgi:hypothetical protein